PPRQLLPMWPVPWRRPPPLGPVRAFFPAHGSCRSRTSCGLRIPEMDLLMAIQVQQHQVGRLVRAAFPPLLPVVTMQLFSVEQIVATDGAGPALSLGPLLVRTTQVTRVALASLLPVALQACVVRRGRPFDHDVLFVTEPAEPQAIGPAGLVAEDPSVFPPPDRHSPVLPRHPVA